MIAMCGYEKSGNSLLWNILRIIQECEGNFSSYTRDKEIFKGMSDPFLFKNQEIVDEITFDSDSGNLYIKKFKTLHPVTIETLAENSSLLWSHDILTPDHVRLFGQLNATIFYIIRDPRAVCLSLSHHVVRPEYLAFYPEAKITDAIAILNDLSFTEKWVIRWKKHIGGALAAGDKINIVKYEELNSDKKNVVVLILKALNRYSSAESMSLVDRILDETSFKEMKKESPTHVRSGQNTG